MANSVSEKLLAHKDYDQDAYLRTSDDPAESGTDDDFGGSDPGSEVHEGDRAILQEEDDREKLLSRPSRLDKVRKAFATASHGDERRRQRRDRRDRRKAERRKKNSVEGEATELMFEMEGGFKDTSSGSSSDNEIDRAKWTVTKKGNKRAFYGRIALLHVLAVLVFAALAFGAYQASRKSQSSSHKKATLSNGTHLFGPTTILISLDGFRADFLNRDLTPALKAFIASGVSPKYMLPTFPSVTFPNHFTLVTGLYPESHGIVGNQFWDPVLQEEFYYTDTEISMQPKWWTAEPLWVTAENQGVRSAIHMWPGSEAHIPDTEPTYLDIFNEHEPLLNKVNRILGWLDLPGDDDSEANSKRPQFIAAYVPNVDADGHKYGPNSTEIRGTISDVDSMLTMLVEGLYQRNLTEIVNVVVVSDHGMATTSTNRLIQIDDLIDLSLVDHIDGWPLVGLRLKNPDRDVSVMYDQLVEESKKSGSFDVYTLDTMPERYHFTKSDRIAPLWIIPKAGWAVVDKAHFDVAEAQTIGRKFQPMGLHGYDHEHPLMRAIFIARGPAFPHEPNSRLQEFQNIEVYNIVCDSLGITPNPNNGTLRLPLKTQGLHSDLDAGMEETPEDPVPDKPAKPETTRPKPSVDEHEPVAPTKPHSPDQPFKPEDSVQPEQLGDLVRPEEPVNTDVPGGEDGNSVSKTFSGWWEFIHNQIEKAKEWAKELTESLKANKDGQGDLDDSGKIDG